MAIADAARLYCDAADGLDQVASAAARGHLGGGWSTVQDAALRTVTTPIDSALAHLETLLAGLGPPATEVGGVPVLVFGNLLPEPRAFDLIADCGATVVGDDLCTGSRQLLRLQIRVGTAILPQIAHQMIAAPPCARAVRAHDPGSLGATVAQHAQALGARGAIAHVLKFCDPYLSRMPAIHDALRAAGIPLLVLEGDCTLRSLGQQRTRIEAFVEMIAGGGG
jgi:benzoyl-CoA reductase/2-hydroxyglutaryl-CoA dehydratase subunit BcrC/BadD/HgdB